MKTKVLLIVLITFNVILCLVNLLETRYYNKKLKDTITNYTDMLITGEPDYLEGDLPHKKLGKYKLSWYSPIELGKQTASHLRTSTGKIPRQNWTIAVDPKQIPYGSIVYIENYGYFVAEDCGGSIKGNRIDIFTNSHEEAIRNGRRVANVYLLKE